jgi:hypothetical protein
LTEDSEPNSQHTSPLKPIGTPNGSLPAGSLIGADDEDDAPSSIFGGGSQPTTPVATPGMPSNANISDLNALLAGADGKSSDSTAKTPKKLGMLEIEEHFATTKFAEKPGLDERGILVRVYERMATALCFPPLSYIMNGATIEADANCADVLSKLEQLHSNNTVLTCARAGLDSVECSRSFESQSVRKYANGEAFRLRLTERKIDPLEKPEIKTRFDNLKKQLMNSIDAFSKEKSILNLKAMDAALYPVLSIICSDDGLALTFQQPSVQPTLSLTGDALSLADAIDSLEQRSAKPTPTPAPIAENSVVNLFRTRLLSDQCYDTISDALSIDNRLPSAICYKDSFLSPSCISALRRFRLLKSENAGVGNSNEKNRPQKDGLDSF